MSLISSLKPMLSFDPQFTRVILAGSSQFPNDNSLPGLPSVKNNLQTLAEIFCSNKIVGCPFENVKVILDAPTTGSLLKSIKKFADEADDTLIVYYAGHGLKAPFARGLFLAVQETTQDNCHIDGVEFAKLREVIARSPARKKILILDCCFSGEATDGEMGSVSSLIADGIDISGTYSIASSPAGSLSSAPRGAQYTAFTGHLINVLQEGVQNENNFLEVETLYDEIYNRIRREALYPEPQRRVERNISRFKIAYNAAAFVKSKDNSSNKTTVFDRIFDHIREQVIYKCITLGMISGFFSFYSVNSKLAQVPILLQDIKISLLPAEMFFIAVVLSSYRSISHRTTNMIYICIASTFSWYVATHTAARILKISDWKSGTDTGFMAYAVSGALGATMFIVAISYIMKKKLVWNDYGFAVAVAFSASLCISLLNNALLLFIVWQTGVLIGTCYLIKRPRWSDAT